MPITATVEVLTAEVRVLMVGSRQITKSVWAQLDWAEPRLVSPMGRVEPGTNGAAVNIVGQHLENGSLVRSRIRQPERGYSSYHGNEVWLLNHHELTPTQAEVAMAAFNNAQQLPLIVLAGLR